MASPVGTPSVPGANPPDPAAPFHWHGNVLLAVDAVADRIAAVAAARLVLPQQLAGAGVVGVELAGGLAGEDDVTASGQHRGHQW